MSRGLCSPEQMAACPLRRHFSDEHHLFYERRMYRTAIEKAFRELPENKVQLCRNEHNTIHATQPIPEKPSVEDMRVAIALSALRGAYEQPDLDAGVAVLPTDPPAENLALGVA